MPKPRVLVADQNDSLRSLLRAYLSDAGCAIVEAGDGETALRTVLERRVDLALLDAFLPRRSGIYVLREIRARGSLLVILMSSLPLDELAELATDADGYVRKPFRGAEVAKTVTTVLARGVA